MSQKPFIFLQDISSASFSLSASFTSALSTGSSNIPTDPRRVFHTEDDDCCIFFLSLSTEIFQRYRDSKRLLSASLRIPFGTL